jgi:hypothetical protein
VGSARRDWLTQRARHAGLLGAGVPATYERWQHSIEPIRGLPQGAPVAAAGLSDPRIIVAIEAPTGLAIDSAGVTRTMVSLANQTHSNWIAELSESLMAKVSGPARRTLIAALAAEPRLRRVVVQLPVDSEDLIVSLSFGDSLAPRAFELSVRYLANEAVDAVVGEHDMIDPISAKRSAPASIGALEPDLMDQFDLTSGFLIRRQSVSLEQVAASRTAFVGEVVLHRLVGVRQRQQALLEPQLSPPSVTRSRNAGPSNRDPQTTGPSAFPSTIRFGGTRVSHPIPVGLRATLLIRDPLGDESLARKQSDHLLATAGGQVCIDRVESWKLGLMPAAATGSDVVIVVDGGVTPPSTGWLDDLVGVLFQPHVFAVAPVIVVPSGIVADGGVVGTSDGYRARSGRIDLAPFELARCRQVASLSGRVMVLRGADGPFSFDGEQLSGELAALAKKHQRACVIWAHQQWRLDVGLYDVGPTDSPMLAWQRGRLRSWFDPQVEPHQPEPGRIGEGVW